jgi:hypothetical protein
MQTQKESRNQLITMDFSVSAKNVEIHSALLA